VVSPVGRSRRAALRVVAACAFAALATPARPAPATDGCALAGVPRVVAIGDVHGAYEPLLSILRASGIVDGKGRWAGGRTHLVQLGDVLDRGLDARRCLDLLMRLQEEAAKAGGRVHALLGNHEVMNMLGDLRYVNAAEYAAFRAPQSEARRHHLYERSLARAREVAKAKGEAFDESVFRAKFDAQAPLGFVERIEAFSAEGRYGRWLRERPTIVVVNGVAFVHGGINPDWAALGCDGTNAAVRHELGEGLATTRQDPKAALATGENGPLWYRGLAREDEIAFSPALDRALQAMGARAVVIGHTVTSTRKIETRFGGRVVMIDAGMTDEFGGHAAALEIDAEGRMTAIYPGGREPLAVLFPLRAADLGSTFTTSQRTANQGGAR
jgi:hypothetical protein